MSGDLEEGQGQRACPSSHPGCAGGRTCVHRVSQLNQKYPRRSETSPQLGHTRVGMHRMFNLKLLRWSTGRASGRAREAQHPPGWSPGSRASACAETRASPCGAGIADSSPSWSPQPPGALPGLSGWINSSAGAKVSLETCYSDKSLPLPPQLHTLRGPGCACRVTSGPAH